MAPTDRQVELLSYGVTVARGFGGAALILLVFGTVFLPAAFGGPSGDESSVGIGLLVSAVVCGAVLLACDRWPELPAARVLRAMTTQMSVLFLIFAPVPPALHLFADRGTAVTFGAGAGVVLALACGFGFHRVRAAARRDSQS